MAALNCSTTTRQAREDRAIYRAMHLLESRLRKPGEILNEPRSVRQYLALHLARCECEVFSALWLDTQHRLITAEHLFVGTLSQTSVYPREVVKGALHHNAAAVILAYNHPSMYSNAIAIISSCVSKRSPYTGSFLKPPNQLSVGALSSSCLCGSSSRPCHIPSVCL